MVELSKYQRVWICLEFARTNNASEIIRRWINHWPNMRPPTVRTLTKTYQKFLNEGTFLNVNKGRSDIGRRCTSDANVNVQIVRNSLIKSRKKKNNLVVRFPKPC